SFSKPKEFLQISRETNELKMFFLDIEINKELFSGLEVAKEIRKFDSDSVIIFISTHSELVLTSYKYMVSALQFIEKNIDLHLFRQEIENCIGEYLRKKNSVKKCEDFIIIKLKSTNLKCDVSEIIYFQTQYDHRLLLYGKKIQREFYGSISNIEKLHEKFIRIHQSYVINSDYVLELNSKNRELKMINGDQLPISRRYYGYLKALFVK
ncbi:LytR/AlgR family response regulator transcription factor, partial [Enterococcus sp. RIT-PI-f]|uniref:LytR/AlgR family response regulator transcription factor n=1 Tax=Enterococcus sp. RIT-PI-f TaxID=1690244 RepID=UPI0035664AC0